MVLKQEDISNPIMAMGTIMHIVMKIKKRISLKKIYSIIMLNVDLN